MKLWLLELIGYSSYDYALGFVIRAETEEDAREQAQEHAGDEGYKAWADKERSSCIELEAEGELGVILRDFMNL